MKVLANSIWDAASKYGKWWGRQQTPSALQVWKISKTREIYWFGILWECTYSPSWWIHIQISVCKLSRPSSHFLSFLACKQFLVYIVPYVLQSSAPVCLTIQLMDDGNKKPEAVAVYVALNFAAYLHIDFLSIPPQKRSLAFFYGGNTTSRNDKVLFA